MELFEQYYMTNSSREVSTEYAVLLLQEDYKCLHGLMKLSSPPVTDHIHHPFTLTNNRASTASAAPDIER